MVKLGIPPKSHADAQNTTHLAFGFLLLPTNKGGEVLQDRGFHSCGELVRTSAAFKTRFPGSGGPPLKHWLGRKKPPLAAMNVFKLSLLGCTGQRIRLDILPVICPGVEHKGASTSPPWFTDLGLGVCPNLEPQVAVLFWDSVSTDGFRFPGHGNHRGDSAPGGPAHRANLRQIEWTLPNILLFGVQCVYVQWNTT